jgi:DNA-directed RNA polymerase II subunit RPB2
MTTQASLAKEVQERPSPASSVELLKYRARFDADRDTQLLDGDNARLLADCLMNPQVMRNWDQWRVYVGRSALRCQGLVDHHTASYNYWIHRELVRLIRGMKTWKIASPPHRVHVFKIVKAYVCSPTVLLDDNEEQYSNLSPHQARLSNTAYEGQILVDVAQFVFAQPKNNSGGGGGGGGATSSSNADDAAGGGAGSGRNARLTGSGRFALPAGWESWPLESKELHLRKPLHRFGCLTMSMLDKRSTGLLRPEFFCYEDFMDEGGYFNCQNSSVTLPLCETLAHNQIFTFPAGGASFTSSNDGCETPDEKEPFAARQAKAVIGARLHMNKCHKMEIRCIHPTRRQRSTSTIVVRMSKYKRTDKFGGQQITVQMQFLSVSLPPTVLFMALGFSIDQGIQMMKDIAKQHWYGEAFDPLIRKMRARHPTDVRTQHDACLYIADRAEKENCSEERKVQYASSFLQNEFMPQIGLSLNYNGDKANFLAYVLVKLLLRSCGYGFYDSKDSYWSQRYDTNGTMWASLQRQVMYKIHSGADRILRGVLASQLPLSFRQIFGEQKVSDQIACCLSKGTWSVNRYMTGSSRTGATLALKSTTYLSYISSVRRSNTANKAHRRSVNARQVDDQQYGRLCAIETPEGEMCGIARFQACGSTLSVSSSGKVLLGLLINSIPRHLWTTATPRVAPIKDMIVGGTPTIPPNLLVSGMLVPVCGMDYWMDLDGKLEWRCSLEGALTILKTIRKFRRTGILGPHVSVYMDRNVVTVRTLPGRNVRLLIVLEAWMKWMASKRQGPGSKVQEWFLPLPEALRMGILEYVDASEERSLSICFSFDDFLRRTCSGERFSHMEVDPSWMLGVTAGTLPLSDYNQSPRSVLGSAMGKQTFSGVVNPFRLVMTGHILDYADRAMAQTRIYDDFQLRGLCTGQMVDFVIYASDHTIEDSWEMNRAALDRGMHRTSLQRRYVAVSKTMGNNGRVERFECPGKDVLRRQDANYSKLGPDGVPSLGTMIEPDDIVIGITYRNAKGSGLTGKQAAAAEEVPEWAVDASATQKHDDSVSVRDERGIVQSVRTIYAEGAIIKEVILKMNCLNEDGDKYYSRHGQKGTTGLTRPEVDMMYSIVSGKPAMVHMSPVGILARMTHGHLLEMHKSTAAAIVGKYVDATPFLSKSQRDQEIDVVAALLSVGAQRLSYEVHVNGMTGELTRPLLRGVIYHSALAHLVGNKIHARNRGPKKLQTRQPDDGRSKHGGLRFGQMEVDAMCALGAAHFLVERLKTTSDEFIMPVCGKCGLIAEYSRESGYRYCRPCVSGADVCLVSLSYSNKLFIQELMALHIKAKLILADDREVEVGSEQAAPAPVVIPNAGQIRVPVMANVARPESWEWEELKVQEPKSLMTKIDEIANEMENLTFENTPRPGGAGRAGAKGKRALKAQRS